MDLPGSPAAGYNIKPAAKSGLVPCLERDMESLSTVGSRGLHPSDGKIVRRGRADWCNFIWDITYG